MKAPATLRRAPHSLRARLACLGVSALWGATLSAAPVVNFAAADYVTANTASARGSGTLSVPVDLDGDGADDVKREVPFSDTTAISVSATATQSSGIFYGGFLLRYHDFLNGGSATRPAANNLLVNNGDGSFDAFRIGSTTSVVIPVPSSPKSTTVYANRGRYDAVLLWRQADGFVTGMKEGNIAITSPTAFSSRLAAGSANSGLTGRWLVQRSGTYYVSAESFSLTSTTPATVSSVAATTTLWAPLDLSSGLPGAIGAFGALPLDKITAAGIHVSADVTTTSSAAIDRLQLTSFSLDGELLVWPAPVGYHPGGVTSYTAPYFANGLKTNTGWTSSLGGTLTPASGRLNTQGYPTGFINGETYLSMNVWASTSIYQSPWPARDHLLNGKVTLTWTGEADMRLSSGTLISSESNVGASGKMLNGRRTYLVTNASNVTARIYEFGTTPLTDAAAWLPDPANPTGQTLEGQMFHPRFLSLVNARDWGYIRMMDWGYTNASPQKDWADRRLPAYANYTGILNPRDPTEGAVRYLDGNGNPVYFEGDRTTGVPYEIMIALANATQKDIWICVPHLATADYVDRLARLVAFGSDGVNPYSAPQANPVWPPLSSTLRVYLEYSNEIWASNDNFAQGPWAENRALALGISRAQFIARQSSAIWQAFEASLGTYRVIRVAPAWTNGTTYTSALLTELRDNSALLKPEYLAVTTYFGFGIQYWARDHAIEQAGSADPWFLTGDTFVSGTETRPVSVPFNDPYWQSAALERHLNTTFDQMIRYALSGTGYSGDTGQDAVSELGGFSDAIRDIASEFSLPMIAYEGGPSIYTDKMDGGDVRDDGITHFMSALNRHPRFADVYRIVMEMSFAKNLVSHSMFVDVSKWGKYGQWGHLEYLTQDPATSAKWQYVLSLFDTMESIRPTIDPKGAVPSFTTPAELPRCAVGIPYSQSLAHAGGDGARTVSLLASSLASGLTFDLPSLTIAGTATAPAYNYILLRVVDADGDAAWRIFSFQTVAYSSDPAVTVTFESLPTTGKQLLPEPMDVDGIRFNTSSSSGGNQLHIVGVNQVGTDTALYYGWPSNCLLTRAWGVDHRISRVDGHAFDLKSIDVGSTTGATVTITGQVQGGNVLSTTVNIALTKSPLTTVMLDWVQMSWVAIEFNNSIGENRSGVIDNVRINQGP